eukprot:1001010-Rhodomonas_salina.1
MEEGGSDDRRKRSKEEKARGSGRKKRDVRTPRSVLAGAVFGAPPKNCSCARASHSLNFTWMGQAVTEPTHHSPISQWCQGRKLTQSRTANA